MSGTRLLLDLSGVVDATGACTLEQAGPSSWSKVTIAANAPNSPSAQWKVGIGKNGKIIHLLSFGAGPTCGAGPYTMAPNESIVILVSTATTGDQINGTMYGVQQLDPTKLTMDTPGTSIPPPPASAPAQKRFVKFSIGQNTGTGAHPLITLGTLLAGDTLTMIGLWADVYNFNGAGVPYSGTFQMDNVFQRAMACGGNIGDHDHIYMENYNQQFPGNGQGGNYVFQMTGVFGVGIGGTILLLYSTAFNNPLGGIPPPGWT